MNRKPNAHPFRILNPRRPRRPRPAHAGGDCGSGELPHASMKPRLARFLVTYSIGPRSYQITLPGVSASRVWLTWDRPGSTLIDVRECDENGLPV